METKTIRVATDFSRFPGGRFRRDSEFSGEQFRDDVLKPALAHYDRVIVLLDGTSGYPSSFLEEAFGGLVRDRVQLPHLDKLEIHADDPRYSTYVLLAQTFIAEAKKKAKVAA